MRELNWQCPFDSEFSGCKQQNSWWWYEMCFILSVPCHANWLVESLDRLARCATCWRYNLVWRRSVKRQNQSEFLDIELKQQLKPLIDVLPQLVLKSSLWNTVTKKQFRRVFWCPRCFDNKCCVYCARLPILSTMRRFAKYCSMSNGRAWELTCILT